MATSTQDGDLDWCAVCGDRLDLMGGTDPEDADDRWTERYECPQGHVGRYQYVVETGAESFHGACKASGNHVTEAGP